MYRTCLFKCWGLPFVRSKLGTQFLTQENKKKNKIHTRPRHAVCKDEWKLDTYICCEHIISVVNMSYDPQAYVTCHMSSACPQDYVTCHMSLTCWGVHVVCLGGNCEMFLCAYSPLAQLKEPEVWEMEVESWGEGHSYLYVGMRGGRREGNRIMDYEYYAYFWRGFFTYCCIVHTGLCM